MFRNPFRHIISISLITGFIAVNNSFALEQDVPVFKSAQVNSRVTIDHVTGKYLYRYTLFNPAANTGKVFSFTVDISRPENGKDLIPEGYTVDLGINYSGEKVSSTFIKEIEELGDLLKKPVVPVGMNGPYYWSGGITAKGGANWGGEKDTALISPGQSNSDFELTTEGLPGIRSFEITPFFIYVTDEDARASDIDKARVIERELKFHGTTIGPTAPPAHLVPVDFVTYIIDLKHQAQTLGWIGGPNFVFELDKKLDQIKAKLVAGEIEPAREELGAFIEKVEAHYKETKEHEKENVKKTETREKFITSEGYALLKFNAAYLRDQLGKPKEMEDDKGQEKEPKK